MEEHRRTTRANLGNGVAAEVSFPDLTQTARHRVYIKGRASDIGTGGMFFCTQEFVPMDLNIDIHVFFNADRSVNFHAIGKAVRRVKSGVGIRFTHVNMEDFNSCVMYMLSQ